MPQSRSYISWNFFSCCLHWCFLVTMLSVDINSLSVVTWRLPIMPWAHCPHAFNMISETSGYWRHYDPQTLFIGKPRKHPTSMLVVTCWNHPFVITECISARKSVAKGTGLFLIYNLWALLIAQLQGCLKQYNSWLGWSKACLLLRVKSWHLIKLLSINYMCIYKLKSV